MCDGGGQIHEIDGIAGYETVVSAIAKYETSHKDRGVLTWGPQQLPIRVIVKEIEGETRTFLDLGKADLIPVLGNSDDDVNRTVNSLQNVKPGQFKSGTIHVSRLSRHHLADPKNIPAKDLFVVTGGLKKESVPLK